ncbi:TPA: aldo/keto reductase [Candidatus Marinimicrobia bacterium]|nr:MAG: Aldo/keto reductase [Marinimicrobia bacterium 46_47]KUK91504.1 MAG: Putative oxidoreductase [Marinimicrobia bacterium 46_43]HAE87424.1 aldo/keto reductase [Candidatus Neomarinimicrobiota bacterium]
MKYIQLGKRGPKVSVIGFGAWAIGGTNWGKTDDEVSKKALHTAFDEGVTLVDTADVYGFGHSEELIAEVLKERGGKKDIIIATKAGNDFYHAVENDDQGYGPIRQTYTKEYIISAAEKSLKRLNVEALDILQLHSGDTDNLKKDDPWLALEQLKKDGKILHAGWSVQSFQETNQAFILDEHKDLIDVIQVRYNLLEREAEEVLFPKAQEYGTGVIVRIPLLFGFLTGKFTKETRFDKEDHRSMNLSPEKLERYLKELDKLQPLYERYPQYTKAQIALKFCISHPATHTVIPGAKTPKQVKENCGAADVEIESFD